MISQLSEYKWTTRVSEKLLLFSIIVINLIIKLLPAAMLELGNDEVYYWTYALYPDWSHFDHPPMVGFTIQLFTLNLLLDSSLMIRLGSLILSSLNIIILFYLVRKLISRKAAFISVFLFTSSFYFNVLCGLFILPDTPQIFFVLLALYFGLPAVLIRAPAKTDGYNIMLFGFFTGLAFLSKYHSIFLWLGFGIYVLFHNRVWLRKPSFYLSSLITLILMMPVLIWNLKNNFISFTFHGNRVDLFHSHLNLSSFAQFNFGQFFYQNPIVFVVIIMALLAILRKKRSELKEVQLLLIYLSVPLILLFTFVSLFRSTLPHWTGPVFICLIIISGEWLAEIYDQKRSRVHNTLRFANLLFIIVLIAGTIQIKYGVLFPADKNTDPAKLGKSDFTLDMYGWKQAGDKFRQFLSKENIPPGEYNKVKIISNKWFPAAHIDFYMAHPLKIDLIVPADIGAAHKYYWINKMRHVQADDRFFFITCSQQFFSPEGFNSLFTVIVPEDTLQIIRNGRIVKNMFIYEMTGFRSDSAQYLFH
jgi:hypothetical protein